jgi:raffinose/stachyose/melibiose transport system permease protein
MQSRGERALDYVFLLPALIFLGVFILYPLAANVGFSFSEFTLGSAEKTFVGLDNYQQLVADPIVWTALANNVLYAVVSVVFQVFIAHILAATVLVVLPSRLAVAARSFFFLPVLLSMTVVAILFTFIFDASNGLLNGLLQAVGLGQLAQPWLGDTTTAIYAVISVSQWQSIGYTMLLFIVSMQNIPTELYEATALDGAKLLRQYVTITLPQTREMIFVVMVLTVSGAFTVFAEPYILTGGGPGNASQVLATYMYRVGFFQNEMGYASALATLIFVITLVLSVAQATLFRTGKD